MNIVFCRGLRPKRKELQNYLLGNQIDILALNETFLKVGLYHKANQINEWTNREEWGVLKAIYNWNENTYKLQIWQ